MANNDTPRGFTPWGILKRARLYAVPTAPTINICVGDIVANDNSAVVSTHLGLGPAVYDAAVLSSTPGDEQMILGVVLACFDENMNPYANAACGYIAAGEAGDSTVAGYVLVADDPTQEFMGQLDGEITDANINLNHSITSATLCAPNTYTGRSTQEIASSSPNTTATIPLRLHGQSHPLEDSHASAGCRMIVSINPDCHYFATGAPL